MHIPRCEGVVLNELPQKSVQVAPSESRLVFLSQPQCAVWRWRLGASGVEHIGDSHSNVSPQRKFPNIRKCWSSVPAESAAHHNRNPNARTVPQSVSDPVDVDLVRKRLRAHRQFLLLMTGYVAPV